MNKDISDTERQLFAAFTRCLADSLSVGLLMNYTSEGNYGCAVSLLREKAQENIAQKGKKVMQKRI